MSSYAPQLRDHLKKLGGGVNLYCMHGSGRDTDLSSYYNVNSTASQVNSN